MTDTERRLAAVLAEHEWYNAETAEAYGITARHSQHHFDAVCAICRGDLERIAAALLPVVAEIEAEARADGWDNGWCDGRDDMVAKRSMAEATRNPYRTRGGSDA